MNFVIIQHTTVSILSRLLRKLGKMVLLRQLFFKIIASKEKLLRDGASRRARKAGFLQNFFKNNN